jgi:2-polyprenyl-3-methyl-5-hydroxy-6-metoxy-1,4-benzoquinol methylase
MDNRIIQVVLSSYGYNTSWMDIVEVYYSRIKESICGVDCRIFGHTIRFYKEVKGIEMSPKEALARARDKQRHKEAWYSQERQGIADKMHFYLETDVYPFRQPYLKRHGGFRWYRNLVGHVKTPSILEYGCGSAVLTEYLSKKYKTCFFTVADIPSITLEFVKWKKKALGYSYEILTIGAGKEGIPLIKKYDLIVCQDVLEHTPNPLDIVSSFIEHLAPKGVLIMDFMNAPGGENLNEAVAQRDAVKRILKERLIVLKAIDEQAGYDGLYMKEG